MIDKNKRLKKLNINISELLIRWETMLLIIFILITIINSRLSPYFFNYVNIMNTTFNFTEKAIIALPMIFVIVCGDIDISVASIIALCSVFMGLASAFGVQTWGLIVIGCLAGIIAGFLNGIIITRLNVPAIAVTIGSMSLFRGIAYVILGDKAFTRYPSSFAFLGQGYLANTRIPFQLLLFTILAIIFALILHNTTLGRKLYAIGNNPTAARFSGIPVRNIRLLNFTLTGFCAGIASILLTSRIGSTRPNIADGWELEIITTVVLGGVAITGGKGNILGVIISIFLLGFLRFGMGLVNVPGKVMNIVSGFLLIIAILLPEFIRNIRERILLGKERIRGGYKDETSSI
jgi:rhamnose transport system permease protein